ncbi:purine-cytosine permease Fcy2p [Trichomonascus vanleenenianus]|uniref:cytosine permease n=1 Tax=Trichomonascus vanleenenianus TaxID=2268995 RepID=UPI003EC95C00
MRTVMYAQKVCVAVGTRRRTKFCGLAIRVCRKSNGGSDISIAGLFHRFVLPACLLGLTPGLTSKGSSGPFQRKSGPMADGYLYIKTGCDCLCPPALTVDRVDFYTAMPNLDIEKQMSPTADKLSETGSNFKTEVREIQPPLGKFQRIAQYLGAEIRGIERIPEEEKTDGSVWTAASMWMGGNMVIATFALGALGVSTFGLNFWDSVLTIIFFNALGAFPVAYYSTFGPPFGLRQMVLSRYWFGNIGIRVIAVLNCVCAIGWNAVNTMVSAQMLHTINGGKLPSWAGVIIISLMTFVVSFLGYNIVHTFEKYTWIPTLIIYIITAVRMAKSHAFTSLPMGTGRTEAAAILSFGSAVFGFATGWSPYAADYTVYMRSDANRLKTFFGVYAGLLFPCYFSMILGAACMTGILSNPVFKENYDKDSIGGLFYSILVQDSLHGFGEFCIVIMALSTVANNIPNMYSLGLSAQTVWSGFQKVPRAIWTAIGTGVSIAIAIPAYLHFASFMENFMNLIGYWLATYSGIVLCDHWAFKKSLYAYDPDRYEDYSYLPLGVAALFSFCCGLAGVVIGMAQVWWTGPIALAISKPFGGDVGFPLGFGFAFVVYLITRPIERKYVGR